MDVSHGLVYAIAVVSAIVMLNFWFKFKENCGVSSPVMWVWLVTGMLFAVCAVYAFGSVSVLKREAAPALFDGSALDRSFNLPRVTGTVQSLGLVVPVASLNTYVVTAVAAASLVFVLLTVYLFFSAFRKCIEPTEKAYQLCVALLYMYALYFVYQMAGRKLY